MSDDIKGSEDRGGQEIPPVEHRPGRIWIALVLAGVLLMVLAASGLVLRGREQAQASENATIPSSALYNGPARVGSRMRDFTLVDITGKQVKLSDYSGRPVLINAWATWCPPCQAEMPDLNAFYQKNKAGGFIILGVNAGETRDVAADFAKQQMLSFPILLDSNEALMDSLSIQDYPTSILVGKDGNIKLVHVGMFSAETLDQEILPLIH